MSALMDHYMSLLTFRNAQERLLYKYSNSIQWPNLSLCSRWTRNKRIQTWAWEAPLASAAQRWLAGAGRPFPAAAAVSLCPRCRLPPPRHLLPPRRTSVRTVFFLPRAVFLLLGVPPSVFFLLRAGSPNPSRFWIPFSSSLQVLDPLFLLPMWCLWLIL